MTKSKEPHWQEPTTSPCPLCRGSGEWASVFLNGPCANCDATGLVGNDGEPLSTDDLLPMMHRQRDQAAKQYRQLLQTPEVREAFAAEHEKTQEQQRDKDMAQRKRLRGG